MLGRDGVPLADPAPVLRGLAGIVLIDGSWKEAKTLWWRNPWLLKLHRLVLHPPMPARLGRLRREPRQRRALDTRSRRPGAAPAGAGAAAADALMAALDRLMRSHSRRWVPAQAGTHA